MVYFEVAFWIWLNIQHTCSTHDSSKHVKSCGILGRILFGRMKHERSLTKKKTANSYLSLERLLSRLEKSENRKTQYNASHSENFSVTYVTSNQHWQILLNKTTKIRSKNEYEDNRCSSSQVTYIRIAVIHGVHDFGVQRSCVHMFYLHEKNPRHYVKNRQLTRTVPPKSKWTVPCG